MLFYTPAAGSIAPNCLARTTYAYDAFVATVAKNAGLALLSTFAAVAAHAVTIAICTRLRNLSAARATLRSWMRCRRSWSASAASAMRRLGPAQVSTTPRKYVQRFGFTADNVLEVGFDSVVGRQAAVGRRAADLGARASGDIGLARRTAQPVATAGSARRRQRATAKRFRARGLRARLPARVGAHRLRRGWSSAQTWRAARCAVARRAAIRRERRRSWAASAAVRRSGRSCPPTAPPRLQAAWGTAFISRPMRLRGCSLRHGSSLSDVIVEVTGVRDLNAYASDAELSRIDDAGARRCGRAGRRRHAALSTGGARATQTRCGGRSPSTIACFRTRLPRRGPRRPSIVCHSDTTADMRHIPNALSVLRMLLVAPVAWLLARGEYQSTLWSVRLRCGDRRSRRLSRQTLRLDLGARQDSRSAGRQDSAGRRLHHARLDGTRAGLARGRSGRSRCDHHEPARSRTRCSMAIRTGNQRRSAS